MIKTAKIAALAALAAAINTSLFADGATYRPEYHHDALFAVYRVETESERRDVTADKDGAPPEFVGRASGHSFVFMEKKAFFGANELKNVGDEWQLDDGPDGKPGTRVDRDGYRKLKADPRFTEVFEFVSIETSRSEKRVVNGIDLTAALARSLLGGVTATARRGVILASGQARAQDGKMGIFERTGPLMEVPALPPAPLEKGKSVVLPFQDSTGNYSIKYDYLGDEEIEGKTAAAVQMIFACMERAKDLPLFQKTRSTAWFDKETGLLLKREVESEIRLDNISRKTKTVLTLTEHGRLAGEKLDRMRAQTGEIYTCLLKLELLLGKAPKKLPVGFTSIDDLVKLAENPVLPEDVSPVKNAAAMKAAEAIFRPVADLLKKIGTAATRTDENGFVHVPRFERNVCDVYYVSGGAVKNEPVDLLVIYPDENQSSEGLLAEFRAFADTRPLIVVVPQPAPETGWTFSQAAAAKDSAAEYFAREYKISPAGTVALGYGAGGMAALAVAASGKTPARHAASFGMPLPPHMLAELRIEAAGGGAKTMQDKKFMLIASRESDPKLRELMEISAATFNSLGGKAAFRLLDDTEKELVGVFCEWLKKVFTGDR